MYFIEPFLLNFACRHINYWLFVGCIFCSVLIFPSEEKAKQSDDNKLREQLLREHSDLFPTSVELDAYLERMNNLSRIQQQLNELVPGAIPAKKMCRKKRCKQPDFKQLSANTLARRPDELPYLFEGDIVLSQEQLDELLKNAQSDLERIKQCMADGGTHCGVIEDGGEETEEQQQGSERSKRTLTSQLRQRWTTTFPVPYVIGRGVNRTAVEAGIANWECNTCLRFREFSRLTSRQSGLQFNFGSGCYSTVGRVNGRAQQISIGRGCDNPFVVSHEIAHALGFFHEQSRSDRDSFVRIQTQNVLAGFLNQFTRLSPSATVSFGVPYDLGSVMHYDAFGFARAGLPSIRTVDPNYQRTIGQRFQLSFNDIKKMNFAYCNRTCSSQLPCQRAGYTDPKACNRCRCPNGLAGQLCDQVMNTRTQCGQLLRRATSREQTLAQRGSGDCNFLITAPAGSRVTISMSSIQFVDGSNPCQPESYVEIRYRTDLGSTGARFCQSNQRKTFVSQSREVIVLYRSASARNGFSLRYRIG